MDFALNAGYVEPKGQTSHKNNVSLAIAGVQWEVPPISWIRNMYGAGIWVRAWAGGEGGA